MRIISKKVFMFFLSGILFMPQTMIAESNGKDKVGMTDSADIRHRQFINDYIAQYRKAYETKAPAFLKCHIGNSLFLIGTKSQKQWAITSKRSEKNVRKYLSHLQRIFDSNNNVSINIDEVEIIKHPLRHTIYGVTFHQECQPGSSQNDGYVFMLWDFCDENTPTIYVYAWQPDEYDSKEKRTKRIPKDEIFTLGDFDI